MNVITVSNEIAAQALNDVCLSDDIYVTDLRPAGVEPHIPKLTTWSAVRALFGCDVDRSCGWDATPPGAACWRLAGVQVRTGVAAIIPLVIGQDGQPAPRILVYEYWPGAPEREIKPTPAYYTRYVAGWTDANGVVGFGYGADGVVGPNGGPFAIWPSASPPGVEPQYADCFVRAGWLGGTDHLTVNPIFEYRVKGSTPPPDEQQPQGCLVALLRLILDSIER